MPGSMGTLSAVLDTNVLVSAICMPQSLPADLLRRWLNRQYVLLISEPILTELSDVLRRSKFSGRYGMTAEKTQTFIATLRGQALVLPGTTVLEAAVPDDPDDNKIVACAVEGEADMIVSGDRHLKRLGQYGNIPILSPTQFRRLLDEQITQ